MKNTNIITKIHQDTFTANIYSIKYFRMIGLIDVSIEYDYGTEVVTLAYYSSSGTNSGKIKGLWYPIVGIKRQDGRFVEFTDYINFILEKTTKNGIAKKGWLAKSLFFNDRNIDKSRIRGFSNGIHYDSLLEIGETLRDLYEKDQYKHDKSLDANMLNKVVASTLIYPGNQKTQKENFERFIQDIFYKV